MLWKLIKGMFTGKKIWEILLETKSEEVLQSINSNFYWLCMYTGIAGILLYVLGVKKGSKLTTVSIALYWVVVALCSAK